MTHSSNSPVKRLPARLPRACFSIAGQLFMFRAVAQLLAGAWRVKVYWIDTGARELRQVLISSNEPLEASDRWALAYLSLLSELERHLETRGVPTLAVPVRRCRDGAGVTLSALKENIMREPHTP